MKQADFERRMGFFDHLDELRVRVIRCLWIFMLGFVVCYFFSEQVMDFMRRPLFAAMPMGQQKLYFTSLFENFLTHLKIAAVCSIFILSPAYFFQLWAFIAPGLLPKERKMVVPFISGASIFFILGACFAYFVLFPVGFKYFITYGGPSDVPLLTIDAYYSTVLKLLLLFGVAFELPVLVILLGFIGLIDARFLRKHRKNAVIGISVISALFAPPDALSMIILAVPLILMYEVSIWVVHWIGKKRSAASSS